MSGFLSGAMEPREPSMTPMDVKLENPHNAYVDIISALTCDKQDEQLLST
jgi:hypothetical protein